MKEKIVIATIKTWNLHNAKKLHRMLKARYEVIIMPQKRSLRYERLKEINPRYIFFPHWSSIIPEAIYENFECVVFHMTDLPYGRGGSPLQNLILRKVYDTKISAIQAAGGIDAGRIYLKTDLSIENGSAEEIFKKASAIIFFRMIPYILKKNPRPHPQNGKAVYFRRRSPKESEVSSLKVQTPDDLYDFIRMLDAEGYPKAFIKVGGLKVEFHGVSKKGDKLSGRFEVKDEE